MNCDGNNSWTNRVWGEHQTVTKNDCITRHGTCFFYYSVIPDRGAFVIDRVTDEYITKEFNYWRQNPTAQELCDYINDRVKGLDEEATMIQNRHLESSQDIWKEADLMLQLSSGFQGQLQAVALGDDFYLLVDSNSDENKPLHATVFGGMEYHRSSFIKWEF